MEIRSESDTDTAWETKLQRYHELGVQELVRFDPDAEPGARVRIWDRLEGDLVERVVERETSPCSVLGLWWVVRPGAGWPAVLRLARDARGADLLLTGEEHEARMREAEAQARQAEAQARQAEARRADAAERRVAELEA